MFSRLTSLEKRSDCISNCASELELEPASNWNRHLCVENGNVTEYGGDTGGCSHKGKVPGHTGVDGKHRKWSYLWLRTVYNHQQSIYAADVTGT